MDRFLYDCLKKNDKEPSFIRLFFFLNLSFKNIDIEKYEFLYECRHTYNFIECRLTCRFIKT